MTNHTTSKRLVVALRIFVLFGVMGFAVVGLASIAHAQNNQPATGLAVSPPTFELSANPGDTLKNSVRVDNITDQPLELSIIKRNFTALGEEGGIDLSEQDGNYSLANWIEVSPATAVVGARESKTFDYTITVPANAEPGGRFGSIIFKTTAKPVGNQNGVAVSQEVGALVFIKIAGEVKEKATIASFTTNTLHENGPVGFDLRVKNEGNVQFKPTGSITISDIFGNKVATIPINSQNVLPDATRKMTASWDNFWLFGKYQATASVVYGNNRQILTATTTFWGFPYKLVGLLVAGIGVLVWLLYSRRARILRAFKVLFGKE